MEEVGAVEVVVAVAVVRNERDLLVMERNVVSDGAASTVPTNVY